MIAHYRKLWHEKELLQFLLRLEKQWLSRCRNFLLASVPFVFDWNKERIANEVIYSQLEAINYVHRLHAETLVCPHCQLRRVIDQRVDGIVYCRCGGGSLVVMDEWEPYLERKDIIIWRKPQGGGQYAYKVYGNYDDVTAEDFFFVQTNVEYRKEWDKSALTLDIVDTDKDSNSSVIYWELLWPVMLWYFVLKLNSADCSCSHLLETLR